jgi:hypothetical protein
LAQQTHFAPIMLLCTILTFAMCADPNVAGAISFDDVTVPIVWSHVHTRSCLDVGQQASGAEAGLTRLETAWTSRQSPTDGSTYSGRLVVRLEDARIELTAFSWDNMSRADTDALRRVYQATLWHELGHLRTAKKSIDALNAGGEFSAPTAAEFTALANERGAAAADRIGADQDEYDRIADHGLRQDTLPPPLGGPDTIIHCLER